MSRNRTGTLSQMDRFAEVLADTAWTVVDGNVVWVGQKMGLDTYKANDVMQRIRRRLGSQAK